MAWMKYIRPSCMAVVFLALILTAQAQVNVNVFTDPILRDDYGDIAYENGTILFVAVRDNHTYKAKDASNIHDEGAIGPFYELAASVVDTSLGDDFTSDLVTAIRAKPNFLLVLIHSSLSFGYVLAILVGWLFLIIFPCCCCSACCCGCRNRNRVRPKRKVILVYKYIYLAFVTVLIVFLCVGILLMNSTSDKLSQTLSMHADDVDKIDDIHSYTESTLKQVKALTTYKYDFTVKVVVRDLNNVGFLMGPKVKTRVIDETGIERVYADVEKLNTDAAAIKATLNELQTGKVELDTAYKSYNTALEALQGRITAQAPQSGINLNINFNLEMLPDESDKQKYINEIVNIGISNLIAESRVHLTNIPTQIQQDTESGRKDIIKKMNSYSKVIGDISKGLEDIQKQILGKDTINGTKADVKEFMQVVLGGDVTRYNFGVFMFLLYIIAVVCLVISFIEVFKPYNSKLGKYAFRVYIAFFFVLNWILMLETNSLYVLGVPLQKITCVTLSDLRGVDQVMDAVLKTSAGSTWLGELLYPGKKVSLTLHSAMQGCEQGRTAYHVFQLDKGGIINITEHTNYKKFFDVDTVTKDLKVDFDKVTVQSASLKQFLDFMFKLQDNIVFTTYDRLADIDILTPVENSENSLTPLIAAAVTPAKEELQSIATELKTTREVLGTACKQAMLKLKGTSDKLKKQILEPPSSTLKMRTEAVTTALRNAQNVVKTKAPAIFLEIVDEFKARLTRILDTYVAHVRDEVENQIGICKPISNLFTEITQGFCQFLRALGGWWCAMGWTVFFSLLATYGLVKARNEYIDEYRPKPPIAPHGGAHSQAAPSGGAASSGAPSGGAPPPVAAAQDQGIRPEAAPPAPSIRSADDHGERGSNFGADADGSKLSTATFSQVPPEVARELKEVPIPRMSDFTGATSTTSTEI